MTVNDFKDQAEELGFGRKLFYTVEQAGRVLGIARSTLMVEIHAGRLKHMLPDGRERGILISPAWALEWIEEGTHGAAR